MTSTEAILDQAVERLARMNAALIALRRELLPGRPRKSSPSPKGAEIRRPRDEIERLTGTLAVEEATAASE